MSDLDLRAPLTGLTLVAAGAGLLAIGFLGRSVFALAVAVISTELPIVVQQLGADEGSTVLPESRCDPGCISFAEGIAIGFVIALTLSSAGWLVRALGARARKPRHQPEAP